MSEPDPHYGRRGRRAQLDSELSQVLARLKTARDRKLIARHLGWDGGPPCSLSEAGSAFQITRERARQIYSGALPLIRQHPKTPALDAVLAFVRKQQHERVSDVETELLRRGFSSSPLSLQGVLSAARLFGLTPGFDLDQFGGTWFVGDISDVGRAIRLTAAKHVEHQGATRVATVGESVARARKRPVKEQLVRNILETRPDLQWLDGPGGWFWLTSVSRNRLLTRVQKVLAVFPRIPISKLREAVSRDCKPVRIPESVLRSFCGCLPWCEVRGDDIIACGDLAREEILSGGEAITCAILQAHGGSMPLAVLEEQCYAAGVTRANLWRILSFSPLIQRLERKVYGFIQTGTAPAISRINSSEVCDHRF